MNNQFKSKYTKTQIENKQLFIDRSWTKAQVIQGVIIISVTIAVWATTISHPFWKAIILLLGFNVLVKFNTLHDSEEGESLDAPKTKAEHFYFYLRKMFAGNKKIDKGTNK